MQLKTPKFWHDNSFLPYLLLPFSLIFLISSIIKKLLTKKTTDNIKIICIGNIVIGGAGKTPTAIAVGQMLKEKGVKFLYVSKGYKGSYKEKIYKILSENEDPVLCGDEALLLAKIAPVYLSKKRKYAIEEAIKDGYELVILDDGMQDYSIKKDLTYLVIDGNYGTGNNLLFPAGPCREIFVNALNRSDKVIIVGDKKAEIINLIPEEKIIAAYSEVEKEYITHEKFIAFSGIARPEKFYRTVINNGGILLKTIDFPDHYMYKDTDIEKMIYLKNKYNVSLLTTEKDYVRLKAKFKPYIKYLSYKLIFVDTTTLDQDLDKILNEKT